VDLGPEGRTAGEGTLHLNHMRVAATYATLGNAMSGVNSETRGRATGATAGDGIG
jgi:hypothetical protein